MTRYDVNRPWRKLYNTKEWHRLRHYQLKKEPLCAMCLKAGKYTPATIVDHVVPHKGDEALFFDPNNLQSLDKLCHDSAKQKAEKRGVAEIGCGEDGLPLSKDHFWHK